MSKVVYIIILTLLVLSVVYGSKKKGVAVSPHAYKCGDLDAIDNIAWWSVYVVVTVNNNDHNYLHIIQIFIRKKCYKWTQVVNVAEW